MRKMAAWLISHAKTKAALLSYLILVVVMVFGFFTLENRQIQPGLLVLKQPIQVTSRVPGVNGPAVKQGAKTFNVFVDLCANSDKPLTVSSTVSYTKLDSKGGVISTNSDSVNQINAVEPGCHQTTYPAPLPKRPLAVGTYRQVTQNVASRQGSSNSESTIVITEAFKVVP